MKDKNTINERGEKMNTYIIHREDGSDELLHYGVKGMRWGVRKSGYYENRMEVNTRKADKAKTSYGKARALNRAEINKYYADRKKRIEGAKGIKDTWVQKHGNADAAKSIKAYSNIEMNNARASKTKLFRQSHKVNAMNNAEGAKYRQKIANAKGVKNKAKVAIKEYGNIKLTTLSGRSRKVGQAIGEALIPGLTTMRDLRYYVNNKDQFGKVD